MSWKLQCPNSSQGAHCHFPMDDVLIEIGNYIKCLKTVLDKQKAALEEKEKRIVELQDRNKHLNKAINTLKVQNTQASLKSQQKEQSCACKRRRREQSLDASMQQFDDEISILNEDAGNQTSSDSMMDTAMNEAALNTSAFESLSGSGSEMISATEYQNSSSKIQTNIRQRCLQNIQENSDNATKLFQYGSDNNENRIPARKKLSLSLKKNPTHGDAKSSSVINKKAMDWFSKGQGNSSSTTSQSGIRDSKTKCSITGKPDRKLPSQSYLIRDHSTNKLGLIKTSRNNHHTNEDEADESIFNFSPTETFWIGTSCADITNSFNDETSPPKDDYNANPDSSVILVSKPLPTPFIIDDTHTEPQQQMFVQADESTEDDNDSLADFEMPAVSHSLKSSPKIILKTRAPVKKEQNADDFSFIEPYCSNLKVKQEPLTPVSARRAINPIFQQTESSEEMDDFIKQEEDIDLNELTCEECKTFLKLAGKNMPLKKKEEYLSKCQERHRQLECTPDGFWDPHLNSFCESDPRNEVMIDKRWLRK